MIQSQIKTDLVAAIKAKDELKKSTLRVIIGEFNRVGKEVSDEQATPILKKMAINAKEQNNINELSILTTYLPQQLTEEKLEEEIAFIIEENQCTSMKDMGKVMAALKSQFTGQYDGKLASTLTRKLLA